MILNTLIVFLTILAFLDKKIIYEGKIYKATNCCIINF